MQMCFSSNECMISACLYFLYRSYEVLLFPYVMPLTVFLLLDILKRCPVNGHFVACCVSSCTKNGHFGYAEKDPWKIGLHRYVEYKELFCAKE
jgi:hypothetical protein